MWFKPLFLSRAASCCICLHAVLKSQNAFKPEFNVIYSVCLKLEEANALTGFSILHGVAWEANEVSPLLLEKLGYQDFVPERQKTVCTTGAELFHTAGSCTARTAACNDSFNVEIHISGNDGGKKLLP